MTTIRWDSRHDFILIIEIRVIDWRCYTAIFAASQIGRRRPRNCFCFHLLLSCLPLRRLPMYCLQLDSIIAHINFLCNYQRWKRNGDDDNLVVVIIQTVKHTQNLFSFLLIRFRFFSFFCFPAWNEKKSVVFNLFVSGTINDHNDWPTDRKTEMKSAEIKSVLRQCEKHFLSYFKCL